MAKKQKINCEVEGCAFQNKKKAICELEEIIVSSNYDRKEEIKDQEETICASFKKDKN